MHDVPFAEIDPMFAVLTVLSMLCLVDGVFDRSRKMLLMFQYSEPKPTILN